MKNLFRHLFHFLLYSFAGLIVLLAVLLILARASTPYLNLHKDRIIQFINQKIDIPVHIEHISANWKGLSPELLLENVAFYTKADSKKAVAQLDHITIGFDIIDSLLKHTFEPGTVSLSGATIHLWQNPDGSFRITKKSKKTGNGKVAMAPDQIIAWLAQQDNIVVEQVTLHLHLKNKKIMSLTPLNFELHNELTRYVISGDVTLKQKEKNSTVEFISAIQGKLSKHTLKHWHSFSDVIANTNVKTYIAAKNLQLTPWLSLLPKNHIMVKNGDGLIKWWFQWSGKRQTLHSQARIRLYDVQLQKDKFRYKQPYLSGVLNLSLNSTDWELSGDELQFKPGATRDHQFAIDGKVRDGKPNQIQAIWLSTLRIEWLEDLLRRSGIKKTILKRYLNRLKPQGILHDIYFSLNQKTHGPAWVLLTDLQDISTQAWENIPGLSHVTGVAQITPYHGIVQLNAQGLTFTDPALFSEPLLFEKLSSNLHWTYGKQGWLINLANLNAKSPRVQLNGDSRLFIPRNEESPTLELALQINSHDISQLRPLYPKPYLPKETYQWLTTAIMHGELNDGKLILRGPLDHFPFTDQTGVFQVDAKIQDAAFQPVQGWPVLRNLNGTLAFNQDSLKAIVPEATTYHTDVNNAVVDIKSLSKPSPLLIQMNVDGQVENVIDYLLDTPIRSFVAPFSNQLQLSGLVNGDVKLAISLETGDLDNLLTLIKLDDVRLKQKQSSFAIDDITGSVLIHNRTISANTLSARFLQEPASITIKTTFEDKYPTIISEMQGHLTVDTLRKIGSLPMLKRFTGKTPIVLRSFVSFDPEKPIQLQAQSDLSGLRVDAPNPLSKQANQRFESEINAFFKQGHITQFDFHYGAELAGIAALKTKKQSTKIERAELVLGHSIALLPKVPGITISGHLPNLNLDRWFDVIKRYHTKKTTAKPTVLIDYLKQVTRLNLSFDHLTVLKQDLTPVKLNAKVTPTQLAINLNSPQAKGTVTLPTTFYHPLINANMRYLHISVPEALMKSNSMMDVDPEQLPRLVLKIQQLFVNNNLIGNVTLRTYPVEHGMAIKQLILTTPYMSLVGNGSWLYSADHALSEFKGKISTSNVTDFLHSVSNITDIEGKNGHIDFELTWPGMPFHFALMHVTGQAQLTLGEGRIMYVASDKQKEKMDMGRLLNVFNFSSLSRRLKLDFSDLTKTGYSFDSVTGLFHLKDGRANTKNTFVKGSIADLDLSGSIDLAKKYYNLILGVTPHLTSSLPVIATVAGTAALGPLGPVIGAATWVVDKVAINPGVGKLTHFSYKITGPFDKPTITPLKSEKPAKSTNKVKSNSL